jgi:solute carrier family 35 protein F1/2
MEKKDSIDDAPETTAPELHNEEPTTPVRPPILYSSPGAFFSSIGHRIGSIWTRQFAISFLFGQIISLCITCTNVATGQLVQRNWSLPTTQTFFL